MPGTLVAGGIMVPQRCPRLIIEPMNVLTLHGKRDFADVIKSRILKWGDYPGLSRWAQCNHRGPCKREARGSE